MEVDREAVMSTLGAFNSQQESIGPPLPRHNYDANGHVAQFYADPSYLIDTLSEFIGRALGAGDSAIAVATAENRDALARSLKHRGLDIAGIAKQGRYVALDAAETLSTFMASDWPDAKLFEKVMGKLVAETKENAKAKDKRLAVFGEMVSVLWAQGKMEAALRLERLWNELARTHSFALHCGYPMSGFYREDHGELFMKICEEHSGVIPGETYASLTSEGARLRNITHLQQRALALENEVAERKRAEQDLCLAHDVLEQRVLDRTFELEAKNLKIVEQTRELEAANKGLRQLSSSLLRVQDDERKRLARDLHDSTGQIVALLSMNLSALESEAEDVDPRLAKSIAENSQLVNQISTELRTLSYLLHPPLLDEMGLESALQWYLDGFGKRSGIAVTLKVPGNLGRLASDLETAIFRVIQECLTNTHRHSGSATACIELYPSAGQLILQIKDAGKGIAPEKLSTFSSSGMPGIGLRGIRERIKDFEGELEITSDEKGTQVKISIPLRVAAQTS
jgi:signal transduction histidine kinase